MKSINRTIVVIALLIVATTADAARDALFGNAPWWTWHAIKWTAFFPPLVWLWWKELNNWTQRIIMPVVCYLVWVFVYDILTQ